MSETTNNIGASSSVTVSSNEVQSDQSRSSDAWKSLAITGNLISTKLNRISSNSVTSFDHSSGSERSSDVLSQVSNHTPVTENANGNALLLNFSMDSTSTEASNCLVPDQSPKKNDKIILFSGKSLVAEILSDDDTCPEQCTSNNALWITFDRHILQMTDKAVLECGEELSDRHIQMAQSIIKKQFPLLGGLRNTLLQEQVVIGCTVNAVQILHCNKRKHWITVTIVQMVSKNKVNVNDTLFNKLDYETKGVVKKLCALKRTGDINMIPIQKQQGSKDCGVFVIAIMISLTFDENPTCVTYRQNHLRNHLIDCFINTKFSPFPKEQNENK